MNACERHIAARIEAQGNMRFSDFMQIALYDPHHGYYMKRSEGSDPFGKRGDFFTAVQLQPVFGRLMRSLVDRWNHKVVVDWGAGRQEMREAFQDLEYFAVDADSAITSRWPRALIFANELFDALPVDLAKRSNGEWIEQRVAIADGAFQFSDGPRLSGFWLDYALRASVHIPGEVNPFLLELPVAARRLVAQMSDSVVEGHLLLIDYGYTARELIRFPSGTLMSYRKHQATADVLLNAGTQDITAHIPFDYVEQTAIQHGWRKMRFESMASLLMHAGEADQFASVLQSSSDAEAQSLRLQLKTLLFGMGDSFRALLLQR